MKIKTILKKLSASPNLDETRYRIILSGGFEVTAEIETMPPEQAKFLLTENLDNLKHTFLVKIDDIKDLVNKL